MHSPTYLATSTLQTLTEFVVFLFLLQKTELKTAMPKTVKNSYVSFYTFAIAKLTAHPRYAWLKRFKFLWSRSYRFRPTPESLLCRMVSGLVLVLFSLVSRLSLTQRKSFRLTFIYHIFLSNFPFVDNPCKYLKTLKFLLLMKIKISVTQVCEMV